MGRDVFSKTVHLPDAYEGLFHNENCRCPGPDAGFFFIGGDLLKEVGRRSLCGSNHVPGMPEKDSERDPIIIAVHDLPATDMGADKPDPEMVSGHGEVEIEADGTVKVPYTLWNSLSLSCPVGAEYSDDNGVSWRPATPATPEEIPSGEEHTFLLDPAADLGSDRQNDVRVTPTAEAPKASRPAVTALFFVCPAIWGEILSSAISIPD